jgi:hypothetical protein
MVQGSSPPTFKLSGTGIVRQVSVYGPYNSWAELKSDQNSTCLLELSASRRVLVEEISPFVYGQVPSGLTQVNPKSGEAPQLLEGKFYLLLVYVASASTAGHPFTVRNGKAEFVLSQSG